MIDALAAEVAYRLAAERALRADTAALEARAEAQRLLGEWHMVAGQWGARASCDFLDPRLPDHIWEKVSPCPMTGCWLWTAAATRAGYGCVRWNGKNHRAHRMFYERLVGRIPDDTDLDHRGCGVRCCVNPSHLYPTTHHENVRRALVKERCPCGRPYDRIRRGRKPGLLQRQCSVCTRERVARRELAILEANNDPTLAPDA